MKFTQQLEQSGIILDKEIYAHLIDSFPIIQNYKEKYILSQTYDNIYSCNTDEKWQNIVNFILSIWGKAHEHYNDLKFGAKLFSPDVKDFKMNISIYNEIIDSYFIEAAKHDNWYSRQLTIYTELIERKFPDISFNQIRIARQNLLLNLLRDKVAINYKTNGEIDNLMYKIYVALDSEIESFKVIYKNPINKTKELTSAQTSALAPQYMDEKCLLVALAFVKQELADRKVKVTYNIEFADFINQLQLNKTEKPMDDRSLKEEGKLQRFKQEEFERLLPIQKADLFEFRKATISSMTEVKITKHDAPTILKLQTAELVPLAYSKATATVTAPTQVVGVIDEALFEREIAEQELAEALEKATPILSRAKQELEQEEKERAIEEKRKKRQRDEVLAENMAQEVLSSASVHKKKLDVARKNSTVKTTSVEDAKFKAKQEAEKKRHEILSKLTEVTAFVKQKPIKSPFELPTYDHTLKGKAINKPKNNRNMIFKEKKFFGYYGHCLVHSDFGTLIIDPAVIHRKNIKATQLPEQFFKGQWNWMVTELVEDFIHELLGNYSEDKVFEHKTLRFDGSYKIIQSGNIIVYCTYFQQKLDETVLCKNLYQYLNKFFTNHSMKTSSFDIIELIKIMPQNPGDKTNIERVRRKLVFEFNYSKIDQIIELIYYIYANDEKSYTSLKEYFELFKEFKTLPSYNVMLEHMYNEAIKALAIDNNSKQDIKTPADPVAKLSKDNTQEEAVVKAFTDIAQHCINAALGEVLAPGTKVKILDIKILSNQEKETQI